VALVQFGRNCKDSFEGYRVVALDCQRDSLIIIILTLTLTISNKPLPDKSLLI